MQALLVVDVQNEFSAEGPRAVPGHTEALLAIMSRVEEARAEKRPIAWIRHHNKPHEAPDSPAFLPDTWGARLSPGLGARAGLGPEKEFVKEVFGAFSGTALGTWLKEVGADDVLIVGFFTHMCVSTTAREALMLQLRVSIDPAATAARDLEHPELGRQEAAEVKRAALLHLQHMGATILPVPVLSR